MITKMLLLRSTSVGGGDLMRIIILGKHLLSIIYTWTAECFIIGLTSKTNEQRYPRFTYLLFDTKTNEQRYPRFTYLLFDTKTNVIFGSRIWLR